jgi:hypothetical protein
MKSCPIGRSRRGARRAVAAALSVWMTIVSAGVVRHAQADEPAFSHPGLRTLPPPRERPFAQGPVRFVDAQRGDDSHDGSAQRPWKTIGHALKHLGPGDTLYLRGGTYYEHVYLALAGTPQQPITLSSFPGEQAVLDGSWREFFEQPESAWEPWPQGAEGEFRSTRRYPNARDVVGSFGDSMIGLQTYYHVSDLRSPNELLDWEDWDRTQETDLKPLYVGPGVWYDQQTGYLHARLAHTHLPEPVPNYRGATDPRRVPLVLAPFAAVTLHLDGARHVRLHDLVIRGGGYTTVVLDHARDIELDNVTVFCGTYGIRAARTGPLRMIGSALYGNVAPWTFRGDGSKRDYPGRPHRNISRLNTHALLELDAGRESSVYATPFNDDWEIAYCDFTDAHDGLYLGAMNVHFHHNVVENLQDDGLYLSPMYFRHRLEQRDPVLRIEQNLFRGVLTALAFGGPETQTRDQVFITRNIFDLRQRVPTGRPSTRRPEVGLSSGKVIGDHGSPPWPAMFIYHNTFVMADASRDAAMGTVGSTRHKLGRRVFNNIYVHLGRLPGYIPPRADEDSVEDGNLFWSPGVDEKQAQALFAPFRASPQFDESRTLYPAGTSRHSLVADPRFLRLEADPRADNDYRLRPDSPAINAGVPLPEEWPDPLRSFDRGAPDVGALPAGAPPLRAGRRARDGSL